MVSQNATSTEAPSATLKKGTPVRWVGQTTGKHGHGKTISDEIDGHVLVVVLSDPDGNDRHGIGGTATDEHRVIYCATTWLTEVKP